jgi:hypothetical protein
VRVTTMCSRFGGLTGRVTLACVLSIAGVGTAAAQDDPNPGALTFTGGFDVLPGVPYIFRGIVQESDPEVTFWPYGDIGIALMSGDGAVKSVGVNFGVWNSLHTGSSGLDGSNDGLHYEEDFYATLALGFGGGMTLGTTFTAYTSPNGTFGTVQELSFRVSKSHMLAPYGTVAFELDGAADGFDTGTGTYLELGVGPSWPLAGGKLTVAVPVKVGLSLNNYYELGSRDNDNRFGFFDIGALVTLPLSKIPRSFGSWNLHAGADVFVFGDTTETFNDGDSSKVVGLVGIGVSY